MINLSLFKIQLENGEFYKSSERGRIQHYRSTEKAEAKIKKLGEIAIGAIVVESEARTVAVKITNPEEIVPDTKVEKVSRKKSATKAEKSDENATDEKVASVKAKKTKKAKKALSND